MVLDTTVKTPLEEPQLCGSSPLLRRTIYMNEDRSYGQPYPCVIQLHYLLALGTLIDSSHTEIYFSHFIILGVTGKKVIMQD